MNKRCIATFILDCTRNHSTVITQSDETVRDFCAIPTTNIH